MRRAATARPTPFKGKDHTTLPSCGLSVQRLYDLARGAADCFGGDGGIKHSVVEAIDHVSIRVVDGLKIQLDTRGLIHLHGHFDRLAADEESVRACGCGDAQTFRSAHAL